MSHNFFYLFGTGNLFAYELLRIAPSIEVENWRADRTVKKDLVKVIDGIVCRVFKGSNLKFTGTFSGSLIRELRHQISSREFNILVHFHGLHNVEYDLISWLIQNVPIVATHHGGGNFYYKYCNKKKIASFFAEKVDRHTIRNKFEHTFVQTVTEYNYLKRFLGSGNVSRFTPYGMNFNILFRRDSKEARKNLGIQEDSRVILSVGRADNLKGVQHVINIFHNLKKTISGLVLLCVDIQPADKYYNEVKESGAIIKGHVAWSDLPVYYSAADVLVYLPFDDESLNFAGPGYVNAEALACGVPVVSSLLIHYWDKCINEVARTPRNLDEALSMTRELLNNPPSPERCREVSFKYYNWSHVMGHHLEVYNNLLRKYYNVSITDSAFTD
jgi:glycosyltransferase involved in cell wall biosynthesis